MNIGLWVMGGMVYWITQQHLELTVSGHSLIESITSFRSGVPQGSMQGVVPVAQAKRPLTSSMPVLGGVWQCNPEGRGGKGAVQTSRSSK